MKPCAILTRLECIEEDSPRASSRPFSTLNCKIYISSVSLVEDKRFRCIAEALHDGMLTSNVDFKFVDFKFGTVIV